MIEVAPRLWVGSQADYETIVRPESGWCVVHACKEPYHREALGYTGRAAPKDHPEYLVARRDNRLILNLVDVDDPKYVHTELIAAALGFIGESLAAGKRCVIHCNQGRSRAPSIAMMYLAPDLSPVFDDAEEKFRVRYPEYLPANGMRGFARANWARLLGHVKFRRSEN